MEQPAEAQTREAVLDAVIAAIEDDGFEGVRVLEIARGCRVSSKTIYKWFGSRDELVSAAIARFMQREIYSNYTLPEPGETLLDATIRTTTVLFTTFERHPNMLVAYHRAMAGPARDHLNEVGRQAAHRVAGQFPGAADDAYARDFEDILLNVSRGLIARYVDGEIEVTEIMPSVERTIARLAAMAPESTSAG